MYSNNNNEDTLQRFIFENLPVRGEIIQLHETYQTITSQHNYPQPIRHILGEALSAAGLLVAIIKFKGRLSVQFQGKGKLKLLLAQCDNRFRMRGLVKWQGDELSHDDLINSFRDGVLTIMLDSGPTNRYQGIVQWSGNSIAESIEGYFRDSEQLATKLYLAVNDVSAAGLLLQVIPNSERDLKRVDDEIIMPHWEHIKKLTMNLQPKKLLTLDNGSLLSGLYPEEEIRIFPPVPTQFKCTCSRKRSENAISILGQEEAEAELNEKQALIVTCDFCNKEYVFDRVDVANIFKKIDQPPTQTTH